MTEEQSRALAEFIKDHDKRFEAKARPDGEASAVLLTLASDGTALDPVTSADDYQAAYLDGGGQGDPGPTVRTAWNTWRPRYGL